MSPTQLSFVMLAKMQKCKKKLKQVQRRRHKNYKNIAIQKAYKNISFMAYRRLKSLY
jgi:hypothetical protein